MKSQVENAYFIWLAWFKEISILTAEFLLLALEVTFKIISHEHFMDHPQPLHSPSWKSSWTLYLCLYIRSLIVNGSKICHTEKKLASLSVYVCQVQCYCITPIIKIKSFSCTQMILLKTPERRAPRAVIGRFVLSVKSPELLALWMMHGFTVIDEFHH